MSIIQTWLVEDCFALSFASAILDCERRAIFCCAHARLVGTGLCRWISRDSSVSSCFLFCPSSLSGSLSSQPGNLVPFPCSKRHFTEKRRYIPRGTATRDTRQVTESRFTRTEHYELLPGLAVCPKSGDGLPKSRGMAQLLQKHARFAKPRLLGRVFVPDPKKSGYGEMLGKLEVFAIPRLSGGPYPDFGPERENRL